MKIVSWINRTFTHNRDRQGDFGIRALIHIPIGFIIAVFAVIPGLALALAFLFKFYERNEDAHTKDQAWKDVFGALIGMVIGGLVVLVALIIIVCHYC